MKLPAVRQQGFTIIELMISLSILSLILLLSTFTILQLGSIYSKGTNLASTQSTTRNLIADIGAQLQLGGANPTFQAATVSPPYGALCIGNQRYSFVLNHKLTTADTDHVLWHDITTSGSSCTPIKLNGSQTVPSDMITAAVGNGVEMMPLNSRLVDLYLTKINDLYLINVGVAYGDDDVITYTARVGATAAKAICNGGAGDNFCAVSSLEKIIDSRIAQ